LARAAIFFGRIAAREQVDVKHLAQTEIGRLINGLSGERVRKRMLVYIHILRRGSALNSRTGG
jgi:hypothetical protein